MNNIDSEFLLKISTPIITFLLGILSKILIDRVPFFTKKNIITKLKNESPKVYLTKSDTIGNVKSAVKNSVFYKINLQVKSDREMKERTKLSFQQIDDQNHNCSSSYLLTVNNINDEAAIIHHFIYERYGEISATELVYSILEKDQKITLIFSVKDRPKEIIISFKNATLIYNIQEATGNVITPKISLHNKIEPDNKI